MKNNDRVYGKINEYLSQVFTDFAVVNSITQTKVENAIGFEVSGDISVRVKPTQGLEMEVPCVIALRQVSANDSIGYMSLKLATNKPATNGEIKLHSVAAAETVEIINTTEIIISKSVIFRITVNEDECRELIKFIELNQTEGM